MTFNQKVKLQYCSSLSRIDLNSLSHIEVGNYVSNAVDFWKFSQCVSRITLLSECDISSSCSRLLPTFLSLLQHTKSWKLFVLQSFVLLLFIVHEILKSAFSISDLTGVQLSCLGIFSCILSHVKCLLFC